MTSRLGRSSRVHSRAGSVASESFSATSDEVETIQWKRGNVLGKGAYGTVSGYNPFVSWKSFTRPHPHQSRVCAVDFEIMTMATAWRTDMTHVYLVFNALVQGMRHHFTLAIRSISANVGQWLNIYCNRKKEKQYIASANLGLLTIIFYGCHCQVCLLTAHNDIYLCYLFISRYE